jgi:hypothetical protein
MRPEVEESGILLERLPGDEETAVVKLKVSSALDGFGECHLVGIVKVHADRDAVSDSGDVDAMGFDELGEVNRCRFSLDRRARREDHLLDTSALKTINEILCADVRGTDPIEWRESAEQNVVETAEAGGALNSIERTGFLDHQDRAAVSLGITTEFAEFLFGDVAALTAEG